MKQNKITQIDLNDVPSVYHNLKYNDGEIFFADNITSIPGLMKQFQVNFIVYVMVLEGHLTLDLNSVNYRLRRNCSLLIERKMVIDNVKTSENFRCRICAISTDVGFSFINKNLMQSVMHLLANPVIEMEKDDIELMVKYYDLLVFKMDHPEMNFGRETMRDIIRCFAYDLLSPRTTTRRARATASSANSCSCWPTTPTSTAASSPMPTNCASRPST